MANFAQAKRQDTIAFWRCWRVTNLVAAAEITQLALKRDMHIQRERTFRITRHSLQEWRPRSLQKTPARLRREAYRGPNSYISDQARSQLICCSDMLTLPMASLVGTAYRLHAMTGGVGCAAISSPRQRCSLTNNHQITYNRRVISRTASPRCKPVSCRLLAGASYFPASSSSSSSSSRHRTLRPSFCISSSIRSSLASTRADSFRAPGGFARFQTF